MFPTYQCLQKVVRVFFYFDKNLVIYQTKKTPVVYTFTETKSINNPKSKQNKKNSEKTFADIGKTETSAKFL